MGLIDFKKFCLEDIFRENYFGDLSFQSEINISKSRDIKNVRLKYNSGEVKNKAAILIDETQKDVTINVLVENICNNRDIRDDKLDGLIIEISKLVNIIVNNLKKYMEEDGIFLGGNVNVDPLIVDVKINKLFIENPNISYMEEVMLAIYESNKPNRIKYATYPEDLILFGTAGKVAAEMLKNAGIANYIRMHSGYLIKFIDENMQNSNEYIKKFSYIINKFGVPNMVVPLFILDKMW